MNNGASFANGNGPQGQALSWPCPVDWLAGNTDPKLLSHWGLLA